MELVLVGDTVLLQGRSPRALELSPARARALAHWGQSASMPDHTAAEPKLDAAVPTGAWPIVLACALDVSVGPAGMLGCRRSRGSIGGVQP